MAGLWEANEDVPCCTILTYVPNELVRRVHNRMPVILQAGDYATWLDPAGADVDQLESLVQPYPANKMIAYPVSEPDPAGKGRATLELTFRVVGDDL